MPKLGSKYNLNLSLALRNMGKAILKKPLLWTSVTFRNKNPFPDWNTGELPKGLFVVSEKFRVSVWNSVVVDTRNASSLNDK